MKLKRSRRNEPTNVNDVIIALLCITGVVALQVLSLLFISIVLIKL